MNEEMRYGKCCPVCGLEMCLCISRKEKPMELKTKSTELMREILFRGQKVDTGEWVYGSLIKSGDCDYFIFSRGSSLTKTFSPSHEYHAIFYKVIPETVGQYTGLKDKNGVKIFEGDMLDGGTYVDGERKLPSEVRYVITPYTSCFDFGNAPASHFSTVIGNIHDNPEIKEKK